MEIERKLQETETYPAGTLIGEKNGVQNSIWMIVKDDITNDWKFIDLNDGTVTTYDSHEDLVLDIHEEDYVVHAKLVKL